MFGAHWDAFGIGPAGTGKTYLAVAQAVAALQNGARIFTNYCLGCHSATYMRYNRLHDVGLSDDQIKNNLLFTTDKDTGRSRGFAFVDVEDDGQAQAAIAELNGKDFGGRALVVNEAQERGHAGGGGKFGGGGGFRSTPHGKEDRRGGGGGFGMRGQETKRGSQRGGGRGGTRGS